MVWSHLEIPPKQPTSFNDTGFGLSRMRTSFAFLLHSGWTRLGLNVK